MYSNFSFGILGVNPIPANSAVLVKATTKQTNFVAFHGVRSTKPYDIVLPVLTSLLGEYFSATRFVDEYGKVNEEKSGINALKPFAKFLSGSIIYKSDSNGQMTKGLILDEGLKLSQTALRINDKQLITTASGSVLKSAIYNQVKAIVDQCTPFSAIDSEISDVNVKIAEAETAKAKDAKKAKTETTKTATATA